ncbi:ABC transporter substrate-binding protein [Methylorubrum zatmanii]|uniref:ABC transporter substrate-binding protein n=1 Tax=Methylorubrum zatmanii TaxID=29429 RepID=A0ABW1WT35_9HYPH|nr:ABC transporter substrate-binding protein [Methylorubrum zatmanii]MBD8909590.1 myristoyl transferase [Methylorubrum zatmanii]
MLQRLRLAALAAATLFVPSVVSAQEVVRVGNLKLAHFAGVSYVKEIAKSCGLTVDLKIFAKGPDIMQAMLAGELDVGATASEAAISARGNGAPVYIVGGFAKGGARLLATPDSGIKSAADLKGKKVGVTRGSIQEVLLGAEMAKHGLKAKDVNLIYLGYPDLNQALLQKQVDAIMQTEPQSSQAIARGFGVEVIKPYDTPVGTPIRTLVMTETFYKDHSKVAAKFMECFVKAQKTFIDDPKTAETFVTQDVFKGQVTGAEFQEALANSPYTLEMSADHIQKTTDVMAEHGIGKMSKPAKATDWVKLDLLEAAKASAGAK